MSRELWYIENQYFIMNSDNHWWCSPTFSILALLSTSSNLLPSQYLSQGKLISRLKIDLVPLDTGHQIFKTLAPGNRIDIQDNRTLDLKRTDQSDEKYVQKTVSQ